MRVVILGGGGHAAVVAEALQAGGEHDIVGFHDDAPTCRLFDVPHRGPIAALWPSEGYADVDGVVLGVGSADLRRRWLDLARNTGLRLPCVIHPRACVSPSARLGDGVMVMAGAVVQARVVLGAGTIVNTAASVDHDCVLGDAVHIAPGARLAGNITVGAGTLVGIGAVVVPGRAIGAEVLVAAGAVVTRDVPAGARVAGVPARAMGRP